MPADNQVQLIMALGLIDAHPDFRVLRRVPSLPPMPDNLAYLARGIYIDVETTGLDPAKDEIIQIAMLPFAFDGIGSIIGVGKAFVRNREPSIAIPEKVSALTGLDIWDVCGASINPGELAEFAGKPDIVIAHNAAFDRRFVERFCPEFQHMPWACSQTQVAWADEGFEGTRLSNLAYGAGWFFDAHRAEEDCRAALALLSKLLPKSGKTGLAAILETALEPSLRFWAIGAPFDQKDVLKQRGYRWNSGEDGRPRAWWRDVVLEQRAGEEMFLDAEVYQGPHGAKIVQIDAYDRFSERC